MRSFYDGACFSTNLSLKVGWTTPSTAKESAVAHNLSRQHACVPRQAIGEPFCCQRCKVRLHSSLLCLHVRDERFQALNWRDRCKYHQWIHFLVRFLPRLYLAHHQATVTLSPLLVLIHIRIVHSVLLFEALLDRHFDTHLLSSHPFHLQSLGILDTHGTSAAPSTKNHSSLTCGSSFMMVFCFDIFFSEVCRVTVARSLYDQRASVPVGARCTKAFAVERQFHKIPNAIKSNSGQTSK